MKKRMIVYWKKFGQILISLFPSAIAYVNFQLIWVFLLVLSLSKEPLTVLFSGFATLYFLNEWIKEMEKKGRRQENG